MSTMNRPRQPSEWTHGELLRLLREGIADCKRLHRENDILKKQLREAVFHSQQSKSRLWATSKITWRDQISRL